MDKSLSNDGSNGMDGFWHGGPGVGHHRYRHNWVHCKDGWLNGMSLVYNTL